MLDSFLNKERKLKQWEDEELQSQNSSYLTDVSNHFMKLSANCKQEEKVDGEHPCSGSLDKSLSSKISKTTSKQEILNLIKQSYPDISQSLYDTATQAITNSDTLEDYKFILNNLHSIINPRKKSTTKTPKNLDQSHTIRKIPIPSRIETDIPKVSNGTPIPSFETPKKSVFIVLFLNLITLMWVLTVICLRQMLLIFLFLNWILLVCKRSIVVSCLLLSLVCVLFLLQLNINSLLLICLLRMVMLLVMQS